MVFDVSVALTWILFIALFPITYFWMRRAWRIVVRRDYSEVALKRGVSPANPARFAPFAAAINLIAGGIIGFVIIGVLAGGMPYETWTASAGSTLWLKFMLDFALSRHAHPFILRNRASAGMSPAAPAGQIRHPLLEQAWHTVFSLLRMTAT